MDYFSAKINQMVVEKSGTKSLVRSFISKPPQELDRKRGRLFGLLEIESTKPKILDLINLIIEEIKTNYYGRRDITADTETIFEATLQKTNLAISAFLETEQVTLDLEKINILIGIIIDRELYFTVVGSLNIFLFQYLERREYRIINILEITKTPRIKPDPLKIFSQVITGRIGRRDILFLATPNLLDYFSLERIKNIITEDNLNLESDLKLKETIQNLNAKDNFGAIISTIEKVSQPISTPVHILKNFDYQKAAEQDSMKELIRTEKETEKLLTPSLLPEIRKYAAVFKKASQNYLAKIRNTSVIKNKKIINLPKISLENKLSKNWINWQNLTNPWKQRVKNFKLPEKLHPLTQRIKYLLKLTRNRLFLTFYHLPLSRKILLIIALILALLFLQSIIWIGIKNQNQKRLEEFNRIVFEAQKSENEAEASLIYRDEDKARELLVEAKKSLLNLKPRSETQKDQIALLTDEIEKQLEKLRHLVEIEEPTLIINFQNLDSQAEIANFLVSADNKVYTQNYRNQSIYKANLITRVLSGIYSESTKIGNFILGVAINDNEIIFLDSSKKAFLLNPNDDTIENISFASINDQANFSDLTSYNNRLYLLDKNNNQIYRYSKIADGYGNMREWLDDNRVNLRDVLNLAVDGAVYLLENNGKITKLENGKKIDFQMAVIDPPLTSPTKIKTTDQSDHLYVLDPSTKRLVVLDKEGRLISQYASEKFDNLKDFIVIESEKKIYFLNGTSIFGIPANHLK